MDINQRLTTLEIRGKLSALWIFVFLNIIFRDIHEFFRPELLQEAITGVVNGTVITDEMMLIAGILLEIPILMVILSRVLPYRVNRWANIIVAPLTILITISAGINDMDDMWFISIASFGLLYIMWTAWTWRKQGTATLAIA